MHRLIVGVLIVVFGATLPAAAQSETGPALEVAVGLDGFVAAGAPSTVEATISSPVLIAGRMRVRGSGVSVSRPVEVPAGSEQVYELTVPPLDDGTRLTVEILDGDGEPILSESVTLRFPFDELTVGIIGDDQLDDTLARVRTIITDRPVAPLVVPLMSSESAFDVLDYLVLGRGGTDRLDDALEWATAGGGLVLDSSVASASDLVATPVPTGVEGVSSVQLGTGRVVVVTGMESRSGEDWAAILRPTPIDLGESPEAVMFEQGGGGLLQAASDAGSNQVPSLPWLFFAILGFALLVGPINFIVLSRLRKRDWAWVTIPALALVAVAGFWVAGRQRIAGTNLAHASIIVADGVVEARSAVLVAAGVSGERLVSFDEEASIFPERPTFGGSSAELKMESDNSARLELDQLGFTGVGLVKPANDVALPSVTVADGQVTVENGTDLNFWGWGVVRGSSAVVAGSDLAPGGSSRVANPQGGVNQFGFGFIDALINQRQLWDDPQRSNSLWPLGQVLTSRTDDAGLYFVGLTDDYQPQVAVNGSSADVPGPTMLVIRIGTVGPQAAGQTSAAASVVGTGFINWLDWGQQRVVSTDELTVSFTVPDSAGSVRFRDSLQFGIQPLQYLGWDWGSGEFTEIERNEPLPPTMVSADGQVYLRLIGNDNGDNPFSPDSLSLEWEA